MDGQALVDDDGGVVGAFPQLYAVGSSGICDCTLPNVFRRVRGFVCVTEGG